MTKLALVAVVAATALATSASATPNPKTCNAAFLNSLSTPLASGTGPYGGCLANTTASLSTANGFPANVPAGALLAGFASATPLQAAQALVGQSTTLTGAINQIWWGVAAGAIQTAASSPTPTPCPTAVTSVTTPQMALSSSANPCSAGGAAWAAWASPLVTGPLNSTYTALVEAFAYNVLIGVFQYVPPCLPTACQNAIVPVCQAPTNTALQTSTLLGLMAEVFVDVTTYQQTTAAFFQTTTGQLVLPSINGSNPAFISNPGTFNCTSFGGWGASLSVANGGTKGDAASSARVGVLAAAVAVMAAAIAA